MHLLVSLANFLIQLIFKLINISIAITFKRYRNLNDFIKT